MAALPVNNIPRRYSRLTPDESAALLARKLRKKEPFFFVRYGDGAIECIGNRKGRTCDGEIYSPDLGIELLAAWKTLMAGAYPGSPHSVLVGDWTTASFEPVVEHTRYNAEYAELIGDARPEFLHFESLLMMRESLDLLDFYRALARDSRQKLFMGPAQCWGAARMLHADHLVTPLSDLFLHVDRLTEELMERQFEVLVYGAGMAGNIPAIRCWDQFPERTFINVGSAFDPLFRNKSRRQQLPQARLVSMFRELL